MEGGERKKISFGLSLADEKIKLIDILSEDDDFLVGSHLCDSLQDSFSDNTRENGEFRLSGFRNPQEIEAIKRKEENTEQPRPSFLRRSLAWDSAFFNNAGVLDPDELSLINGGFGATADVRNRRSESGSTTNGHGSCFEWFEIEPFEGLQTVQGEDLTTVDKSFQNKMKSNRTPNDKSKSINLQSTEKLKKKPTSGRKKGTQSPLKPLTASVKTKNISTRSISKDLSTKFDTKMETKSAKTHLQTPKQNSSDATAQTYSVGSLSTRSVKPSGIRPPMSRIRFFDENTPPRSNGLTRSRKKPQKVSSESTSSAANSELSADSTRNASAYKKPISPCSQVSYKKPRTGHQENVAEDQVGDLSKYFESIDLSQEKKTQVSIRTPRLDKTSAGTNLSGRLC